MPSEIRYYTCPHCGKKTRVLVPEALREQTVEVQCEICLKYFELDLKQPSEQPSIENVYRN